MSGRVTFTVGSGNVFADLGLPDAEERLAKAELAHRIYRLVEERGWEDARTAAEFGIDPAEASALLGGRLAGFSIGRLFHLLNALDQDIEIVVRPNRSGNRPAGLTVAAD